MSGDDIIALESDRYRGSYLDAHHSLICHITGGFASNIWAQWRIAIGPGEGIKDGYEVVASVENKLDMPLSYEYRYTLGINFCYRR